MNQMESRQRSPIGASGLIQPATGRPRLCFVVSSEMTIVAFLRELIAAASVEYDVSIVANSADTQLPERLGLRAQLIPVGIERRIAAWRDLVALVRLIGVFRRGRFDVVHSVSPKAGLLGMLASTLAGVPCRIHTFTGQVWATRRGFKRRVLKVADRLIAALTTRALVDSPSQRDFLIAEGILEPGRSEVIGHGSICGIDGARFHPNPGMGKEVRGELAIPETAAVLLFVGRLSRDKGVLDLAAAYAGLAQEFPNLWLLLVGPDEDGLSARIREICGSAAERLRRVDFTDRPECYMAAADVFCLPSYREGFGMVVIEAAAAGLPAVASRIYGITDAVVEGETGLMHPPGDVGLMTVALRRLIESPRERRAMGQAARQRALRDFSQAEVQRGQMDFYRRHRFAKPE